MCCDTKAAQAIQNRVETELRDATSTVRTRTAVRGEQLLKPLLESDGCGCSGACVTVGESEDSAASEVGADKGGRYVAKALTT